MENDNRENSFRITVQGGNLLMKKLLIVISLLFPMSVFALCPLDPSGNNSCSENIVPNYSPIYENNNPSKVELQPLNTQNPLDSMRNPNNRINSNLNCPLGICSQEGIRQPYNNLP
jgi:hypothetical protein